ncbi:unnamed protein product [Lactuca saligna]|uniref:NAC domain-containing protein n=1 Tax=Lactuca saligna TaxID=75948 RepID=A0AA35Y7X9_LACSI|nr:unnamed protein product [Lactuca saligna]
MHEYRMKDDDLANQGVAQEAYVICKVFEKRGVVTLLANPNNITSLENERLTNVPVNDDVMLTQSDLAPMLCNNDTQEVEDGSKGKLADMSNLDDLGQNAINMFFIDGFADDDDDRLKLDAFLQDDFLD